MELEQIVDTFQRHGMTGYAIHTRQVGRDNYILQLK